MVVDDVALDTVQALEQAGWRWREAWDDDAHDWVADRAVAAPA